MAFPKMRNVRQNRDKDDEDLPTEDKQSPSMFWFCILSGTLLAINTVVDIFQGDFQIVGSLSQVISVLTISVFIGNTCLLCEKKRNMFLIYFLLDNALLIFIFTMIARNSLMSRLFVNFDTVHKTVLAVNTINYFVYIGNFRVMMIQCNWKKWKVICAKISLLINAIIYLTTGTLIMIDQLDEISKKYGSTEAASIKDLMFFYIFGMFGLVLELYGKISDRDGTSNLQYYYSFQKEKAKKVENQSKENMKEQVIREQEVEEQQIKKN